MLGNHLEKTLEDIQNKIDKGDAVILTAAELGDLVRKGQIPQLDQIDVVTTATSALMSGTYAVLSFKVAQPDTFTCAAKVWINRVPAQVGPCPNERIGVLDLIILGTTASDKDAGYGAGDLFRDLVFGEQVIVDIETDDGRHLQSTTRIKQIPHAVLHASRNAFKNYLAFVNPGNSEISTIFHTDKMKGRYEEMTFCGCGEINPIENDPNLQTIGVGTQVLINGAPGFVTGAGTRSSAQKPNLTGQADMHHMDPGLMGGFKTGHGQDIITTWAVPIPILNQDILDAVLKTDDQIPLNVVDVRNRQTIAQITYAEVWKDPLNQVVHDPGACLMCESCRVIESCPVNGSVTASRNNEKGLQYDSERCFNCGLCLRICPGGAFSGTLVDVFLEDLDTVVPITLRQSDRIRACRAAEELKQQISTRKFRITAPFSKIRFPSD